MERFAAPAYSRQYESGELRRAVELLNSVLASPACRLVERRTITVVRVSDVVLLEPSRDDGYIISRNGSGTAYFGNMCWYLKIEPGKRYRNFGEASADCKQLNGTSTGVYRIVHASTGEIRQPE